MQKSKRLFSIISTFLCCFVGISILFSACLSTPFEIAGDVVGGAIDVAGEVASAPFEAFGYATNYKAKATEEREWTLDAVSINHIHAETTNGFITVKGSERKDIHVKAKIEVKSKTETKAKEWLEKIEVKLDEKDGRLHIYKTYPEPKREYNLSVSFEIETPAKMNLKMQSTNGRITMKDIRGNIFAKTTNAQISAASITGGVECRSTNGRVMTQSVEGPVIAHTTNGRIEANVSSLVERADFVSTNGSIHATVHSGLAPVSARTTNGSIHIALPPTAHGQLEAKTTNGSVSCDFPVTIHKAKRNYLKGDINGSGDIHYYLGSTNGSLKITQSLPEMRMEVTREDGMQ